MRKLYTIATLLVLLPLAWASAAHDKAVLPTDLDVDRRISFPDTAKYQTLGPDPHTHSSFYDGNV